MGSERSVWQGAPKHMFFITWPSLVMGAAFAAGGLNPWFHFTFVAVMAVAILVVVAIRFGRRP